MVILLDHQIVVKINIKIVLLNIETMEHMGFMMVYPLVNIH